MPSSFRFPTSNREALAHVDSAELIALTRDLIRIPSVVRPGDPVATEAAVAEYVERWLTKEGLSVEVQPVAAGRPNVLGWIGEPSAGRTLLLEGHTDVVTEGDPAAWTHPPFAADVTDGRIWGRGAADMKGGLAAAMIAAAAIKRSGARFQGALVVGALVDEEGDMIGARHLCGTPLGRALTAAGVAGALLGRRSKVLSVLSGAALLAASLATRFGVFDGGVESAKDPKYTVVPQRDRLSARSM